MMADIGVTWPPARIVWDSYNPHPDMTQLPREVVFIGAGSGSSATVQSRSSSHGRTGGDHGALWRIPQALGSLEVYVRASPSHGPHFRHSLLFPVTGAPARGRGRQYAAGPPARRGQTGVRPRRSREIEVGRSKGKRHRRRRSRLYFRSVFLYPLPGRLERDLRQHQLFPEQH